LWHILEWGAVAWTLFSIPFILCFFFLSKPKHRPGRPPTKPFQGRLSLPDVEPKPFRTLRSIDDGDLGRGDGRPYYVIVFDRHRHEPDMARRLAAIRDGKRVY
jgi:hypothetical protein